MQPQIQQKLKAIIVEHGTSLLNDPRRIKAMLKDLFPQNKREVRVLSAVLDEGLAQRLLRDGGSIPTSVSIPKYAQILHDDVGVDLALAKWAVETWAMALSLEMPKVAPAPTLPPTQKPTLAPTPRPTSAPTQKPTPEPTPDWMQRLWDWADNNSISSDKLHKHLLTNLTDLNLRQNQLTSLPAEIGKLTNLTNLYLSGNQLTSLPAEIGKLTNLTKLELNRNQLTSLPIEIGKLDNLTKLWLSDNQLTSLPAEIGKLTNLTDLDLRQNQLTSLPIEIGNLTNLTELDLNRNQLTSLPAEIGQLTNLITLDLSGNPQLNVKTGGFFGFGQETEIDRIKRLLPNCEVIA